MKLNNNYHLYEMFIKPFWAPPAWIFKPVWSILYIIITISFGFVFYKVAKRKISWKIALPFVLNLFCNLIFVPIQFKLQSNLLSSLDISIVLVTLAWSLVAIWPKSRWVSIVNIPYLIWVLFATALQLSISYLN